MKNYMRTDDRKLASILLALIAGADMVKLEELAGSKTTAFRYLNVLEDIYGVEISNHEKIYKIESIASDAVWRVVFDSLQ